MAFALALQAVHDLPNNHDGEIIFTATTAIVVLTVSFFPHTVDDVQVQFC